MKVLFFVLLLAWGLGVVYSLSRRPPPGFAVAGPLRSAVELEFLSDLSFQRNGRPGHEQRILAAILAEIEQARRFIIVDIFLFNTIGGRQVLDPDLPSPVARLTEALLKARRGRPELAILFLTDEINTGYGSYPEPHLERLVAHGVVVVPVDLSRLPDSNILYSGLWRPLLQWFPAADRVRLPNPFAAEAPALSLRSYLRLLNFKANHRKLLITERAAVVSSGNIHDASARHSNIAFRVVSGEIIADLVASELAAVRFSGHDFTLPAGALPSVAAATPAGGAAGLAPPRVRLLTESAIKKTLLEVLAATGAGDRIRLAQFYLTDRQVMAALVGAAHRGVAVRLILDPSRHAFGRNKYGIPNLSSAARLREQAGEKMEIRWYDTQGEQFHAKLIMIEYGRVTTAAAGGDPQAESESRPPRELLAGAEVLIIGGSANFTRRNLAGYNLETCLEIRAGSADPVAGEAGDFFNRLWTNRDANYTLAYGELAQPGRFKKIVSSWQEFSGLGTF
jgi:cardiolipin synthase A/B